MNTPSLYNFIVICSTCATHIHTYTHLIFTWIKKFVSLYLAILTNILHSYLISFWNRQIGNIQNIFNMMHALSIQIRVLYFNLIQRIYFGLWLDSFFPSFSPFLQMSHVYSAWIMRKKKENKMPTMKVYFNSNHQLVLYSENLSSTW